MLKIMFDHLKYHGSSVLSSELMHSGTVSACLGSFKKITPAACIEYDGQAASFATGSP